MAKNKKNSRVAWSEDEVKLLKRLFPRGRAREIAERTGRFQEYIENQKFVNIFNDIRQVPDRCLATYYYD